MNFTKTITITFGDQAENHVGMQKIGQLANDGFSMIELENTQDRLVRDGLECQLVNLNDYLPQHVQRIADPAGLLVIRQGVDYFLRQVNPEYNCEQLWAEQNTLIPDTKAFMYGRVVNKKARHNLCFSDIGQDPDYSNRRGRVVAYNQIPVLSSLKQSLPLVLGEKAQDLVGEGNYYYDVSKCGIGYHGDGERKRVVAVRLGHSLPLQYNWFIQNKSIGTSCRLTLNHGDIYVMSEKATGFDWRRKMIYTLRHAAGCEKFLTLNK